MSEINIAVLEERINNLDLQIKRFIAHLESEQRVSQLHGRRIESQEKWVNRMQLEIDAHDKLLSNGEGLIVKMDRLTQYVKQKEELFKAERAELKAQAEKFQWTLPNIIAVLSLLATISLGILMYIKEH